MLAINKKRLILRSIASFLIVALISIPIIKNLSNNLPVSAESCPSAEASNCSTWKKGTSSGKSYYLYNDTVGNIWVDNDLLDSTNYSVNDYAGGKYVVIKPEFLNTLEVKDQYYEITIQLFNHPEEQYKYYLKIEPADGTEVTEIIPDKRIEANTLDTISYVLTKTPKEGTNIQFAFIVGGSRTETFAYGTPDSRNHSDIGITISYDGQKTITASSNGSNSQFAMWKVTYDPTSEEPEEYTWQKGSTENLLISYIDPDSESANHYSITSVSIDNISLQKTTEWKDQGITTGDIAILETALNQTRFTVGNHAITAIKENDDTGEQTTLIYNLTITEADPEPDPDPQLIKDPIFKKLEANTIYNLDYQLTNTPATNSEINIQAVNEGETATYWAAKFRYGTENTWTTNGVTIHYNGDRTITVVSDGNNNKTFELLTIQYFVPSDVDIYYYYVTYHDNRIGVNRDFTATSNSSQINVAESMFSREGYVFKGWSTSSDAEEVEYEPGDTVTISVESGSSSASIDFYAVWEEKTSPDPDPEPTIYYYQITFNGNGGTPSTYYLNYGSTETSHTFTIGSGYIASREGYNFKGWATSAGATTPNVGNTITLNSSMPVDEEGLINKTIYAVWEEKTTPVDPDDPVGPDDPVDPDDPDDPVNPDDPDDPSKSDEEPNGKNYPIANDTQTLGEDEDLVIKSTGKADKFIKIEIDSEEVPEEYYEITTEPKTGGTIIKINHDFIIDLEDGEHTISIIYEDGTSEGTITKNGNKFIIENTEIEIPNTSADMTPETGIVTNAEEDAIATNMQLIISLLIIASLPLLLALKHQSKKIRFNK